jgi:hypothetical protein
MADFSRENNMVTDSTTGLQWQDNESAVMNWIDAISYCELLELGGYSNWRLPNVRELYSISDRSFFRPAINTDFFKNATSEYYWSSTTLVEGKHYALTVDFAYGSQYREAKTYNKFVRCVRNR